MITEATGAGAEGPGMEPLRVSAEAVGWRGQEGLEVQLCGSRGKVDVTTSSAGMCQGGMRTGA